MERLSRRNILRAAGAFAGGSAIAGAAIAAPAVGGLSADDADAMALSLFRQWIDAAHDYDRQAAADPGQEDYPAHDVMLDLEDRIFDLQGTATALAIKTHFVIRQNYAAWTTRWKGHSSLLPYCGDPFTLTAG